MTTELQRAEAMTGSLDLFFTVKHCVFMPGWHGPQVFVDDSFRETEVYPQLSAIQFVPYGDIELAFHHGDESIPGGEDDFLFHTGDFSLFCILQAALCPAFGKAADSHVCLISDQSILQLRNHLRMKGIVCVQESDVFSGCMVQTGVAGTAQASVFLMDDRNPGI